MKDISGVLQWGLGDQSTQNWEMGVKDSQTGNYGTPWLGLPVTAGIRHHCKKCAQHAKQN